MARYRALKQMHLSDLGRSRLIAEGEEFEAREGLKGKYLVSLDKPNRSVKPPKAASNAADTTGGSDADATGGTPGGLA